MPPTEPESGNIRSERQRSRLDKRKKAKGGLENAREELFSGEFDGWVLEFESIDYVSYYSSLLVATEYEPFSVIEKLTPYIGGSASIVVHSPYLQVR